VIVQNAVICNKCDDFIVSKHRHDFVECKCGNIFVDGGQAYLRRGGKGLEDRSYSDLSWEISDEIYNECADAVQEAIDTNRNKFGIANAVMRKLRESDRIIADHEPRIMAENKDLEEIMVVESDGTVNRYKKVV
jgi:hypothetical protein